jgi:hypothetical protein
MSDNHYYYGGAPMGGVNSGFGFGNGNGIFDLAALLIVGGIFGGFGWGGGFGGYGGGAAGLAGTTTAAAETAALIGQQNTADRVAAIGADVRQVLGQTGGIIEAVNTVGNRAQDGFARVDTNLCQLGNNIGQQFSAQTMNNMQNHNNLTSQLTEMRFANAQCCCDTKGLIQSGFCTLDHQLERNNATVLRAVAAEGEATRAMLRDIQTNRLQEELAAAKAQLSQNAQTAAIVSAIQAQCGLKCGTPYGTSNCGCNPCGNLFCSVQNAFADEIAQRIINPTTTAAA